MGRLDWQKVVASTQSWIGHAKHADTEGLRRSDILPGCFYKGERAIGFGKRVIRGGVVEQQTTEHPFLEPEQEQHATTTNNNIGFRLAQSARTVVAGPELVCLRTG